MATTNPTADSIRQQALGQLANDLSAVAVAQAAGKLVTLPSRTSSSGLNVPNGGIGQDVSLAPVTTNFSEPIGYSVVYEGFLPPFANGMAPAGAVSASDVTANNSLTIIGSGGTNQLFVSGDLQTVQGSSTLYTLGGLSFNTGGGSGLVFAYGGYNTISTPSVGGGSFTIVTGIGPRGDAVSSDLDLVGHNVINALSGNNTIAAGLGGNTITLGSGANLVACDGPDTVNGGAGSATINVASNTVQVNGGAGQLSIVNTNGVINYAGGTGFTTINGGAGSVSAQGGNGGGVFYAGLSGNNVLAGGTQFTEILGATNGDTLKAGSAGTTILIAGAGNETLTSGGSTGNNVFFGNATGSTSMVLGNGSDIVVSGPGSENVIASGTGSSAIFLGTGAATVNFGAGSGFIEASSGNSTVSNGAGADFIVFTKGLAGGSMVISGFKPGVDHLGFSGYFQPGAAGQALNNQQISGNATSITLSDNTKITLLGVMGLNQQSVIG